MATVQELARILADSLTTQERNGKTITVTKDDKPEWVVDVIHAAHGNLLPDDWTYEVVGEVAELLADGDDDSDIEADIYTHDLLQWLAEYPNAADAVDEWYDETGEPRGALIEQLQQGQYKAKRDIFYAVESALEELATEEEETE